MNNDYRYIPLVRLQAVKEKNVPYHGGKMNAPECVVKIVRNLIGYTDREYLVVCCVDAQMNPTCVEVVSIGCLSNCLVMPREVFKNAVLRNAFGVVACHNHPSGCVQPSLDDIKVTERLEKAGEILGIELVDHVIIGDGDEYYSFREEDKLSEVS